MTSIEYLLSNCDAAFAAFFDSDRDRAIEWAREKIIAASPDAVLIAPGPMPINVIKIVRKYASMSLLEAKALCMDDVPSLLNKLELPPAKLRVMVAELKARGATVEWRKP